jgi:membrane-associated protein
MAGPCGRGRAGRAPRRISDRGRIARPLSYPASFSPSPDRSARVDRLAALTAPTSMEGINWFELFNAMDKFLIGIVERNVVMFYLVLFAIFFSETGLVFMTFLPGDSLLFVAGAVSALPQAQVQGLNVYLLMPIIIAGAILGNTLNYQIGAWLGHKVYDGSIKWIDKSALDKTHAFYERHGGKTVMIARFVPVVRSFAPLVAGASGMDYKKFQLYNVLGAVIWVVSLVYGGYLFGNVPIIRDNLGVILVVGISIVLGPLFVAALLRWATRLWRRSRLA